MKKDNNSSKVIATIILILVAGFLINRILGPEENWGATYDDLGRTVTSFIVLGIVGLILWLMWKKKKGESQ